MAFATRVGINYPWRELGWDFGLPPMNWQGKQVVAGGGPWDGRGSRPPPPWRDKIDDYLKCFNCLGINVVRWVLLGDCINYGKVSWKQGLEWRVESQDLPKLFEQDLQELLRKLPRGMKLLPVLFLHGAFWPGYYIVRFDKNAPCPPANRRGEKEPPADWRTRILKNPPFTIAGAGGPDVVKSGRAEILMPGSAARKQFLEVVLPRILKTADGLKDRIYAWEIINEPELALGVGRKIDVSKGTYAGRSHIFPEKDDQLVRAQEPDLLDTWTPPFAQPDVRSFLLEAGNTIAAAGFKWTIGFQRYESLASWQLFPATIPGAKKSPAELAYIPQFHYYSEPQPFPAPPQRERGVTDVILGEFALEEPGGPGKRNTDLPWQAEVLPKQTQTLTGLPDRLSEIRRRGFQQALGWAARVPGDIRARWDQAVRDAIATNNGRNPCQSDCAGAIADVIPQLEFGALAANLTAGRTFRIPPESDT